MNGVLKTAMLACCLAAAPAISTTAEAQDRRHDRGVQHWDGGRSDHRYDSRRHDGRRDHRRYDYRNDYRYDRRYSHGHSYRPNYSISFSYGYGPRDYGWYSSRWAPQRYAAPVRYVYPAGYRSYAWRVGERLPPSYRGSMYYVDYRPYGLAPPPYGYHWVRVGNDVVLMAIATGIIAEVLHDIFY
jgi:Ni/Co efflux regulator RcnB